jgi:hypothetical protein
MHDTPHYPQPRPRAPIGLFLAGALIVSAPLLACAAFVWFRWLELAIEAPTLALFYRAALFGVPLVGAGLGGAILWRRYASVELLKADKVIGLVKAQRQMFPDSLTSLSYHDSHKELPAPPAVVEEPPLLAPPGVPSFGELLDQGKIGPGRPLILGYSAESGQAIEGSWSSLYSCGIGALQGAGKSWLAAFLLSQSVLQGARLLVCDLHYGNSESLGTRLEPLRDAFLCDIASTPDAILSALKLAHDKLNQRIAGRGGAWDILCVIDEFTSLLRTKVGPVLPGFLEDVTEQGRKFHVNALLSAQGWTKDSAGTVRNRLTSNYVLRQRPDEARYQLGLGAGQLPLDIRLLPDATGYLLDVRGNLSKIVIPQMTAADLVRVGQMIPQTGNAAGQAFGFAPATKPATFAMPAATPIVASVAGNRPESSQNVAGTNAATSASGTATALSADAVRAASLFVAGSSPAEVVKELRGIGSKEGARYQSALNEVLQLIRDGMKEGINQ